MSDAALLYRRYCREGFDEHGVLNSFEPVIPETFNFAYDVVDEIARIEPERRAMVWCNEAGEERFFTFRDLKRESDKAANLLASLGIAKGDKVMLILKRHYQFWTAILALHKLGATAIPGTHLLTEKDILYRFKLAGVKGIICTSEGETTRFVDEACAEYHGLKCKLTVRGEKPGWLDFDKLTAGADEELARVPTTVDIGMLGYFTSGTTGYPKLVVHDHSYAVAHIITARYWHNVDPDGLHLTVSDTGWGKAAWGKLYGQWFCGAGIFVFDFEKFDAAALMNRIEKYRITTFCAPPTIYRFLVKEGMEGHDLSSIRYATTAGEALNPEVFNRFKEYTGLELMEGFGQTETTLTLANLVGSRPKPGSMGKPSPLYPGLSLVDEDGHEVANGVVGEIVLRTRPGSRQAGLFQGYYRNEELTREVWHDNLYHTGDTAWRDENGYFWYVGRTDDVIKSSGYRIGPFEIESVLMEHPAVLECAVTGAPDPVRGIVVKATIVLTSSYSPSDALKKELQNYVKKQTAPYKYPRIVEFVEELPKTISGKIRRTEIRQKDNG
ncbi:MAG: AMP-binding protein [Provencibacterium sp.]|jgi:acetyl-CoA synthetase|nr:AMP-binding protein [Provencibacterium sp.]